MTDDWDALLAEPIETLQPDRSAAAGGWRAVRPLAEVSPRPQDPPASIGEPEAILALRFAPQPDDEDFAADTTPPSLTEQLSLTWATRRHNRRAAVETDDEASWPDWTPSPPDDAASPEATPSTPPRAPTNPLLRLLRLLRREPSFAAEATPPQQTDDIVAALPAPAVGATRRQPMPASHPIFTPSDVEATDADAIAADSKASDRRLAVPGNGDGTSRPLTLASPSPSPRRRETQADHDLPSAEQAAQSAADDEIVPTPPTQRTLLQALHLRPEAVEKPLAIAAALSTPLTQSSPTQEQPDRIDTALLPDTAAVAPTGAETPISDDSSLVYRQAAPASGASVQADAEHGNTATSDRSNDSAGIAVDAPLEASGPAAGASEPGEGGEALPPVLHQRLEGLLDVPLSEVRIFRDVVSRRLTASQQADAVTIGNDVHIAAGRGDPATPSGQALIAHEVAHVAARQRSFEAPLPAPAQEEGFAQGLEYAVLQQPHLDALLPASKPDLALSTPALAHRTPARAAVASTSEGPAVAHDAFALATMGGREHAAPSFATTSMPSMTPALAPSDRVVGGGGGGDTEALATALPAAAASPAPERDEAGLVERVVEAVLRRMRREAAFDRERRGAFHSEIGG